MPDAFRVPVPSQEDIDHAFAAELEFVAHSATNTGAMLFLKLASRRGSIATVLVGHVEAWRLYETLRDFLHIGEETPQRRERWATGSFLYSGHLPSDWEPAS